MYADYHIHTSHSVDSNVFMDDYCKRAIALGIQEVCFTDHVDYDIVNDQLGPNTTQTIDYDAFFEQIESCRATYGDQLTIRAGVEFGIQKHTISKYQHDAKQYPFDFILLSSHEIDNQEFWLYDYQKNKTQLEIHQGYYQNLLDIIQSFDDYSVLAHLDVIKRYDDYGPFDDQLILETHITPILKHIIEHGKGIEVNASSFQYELPDLMPSTLILKKYYELGGTIITIGSDAHHIDALGTHQTTIKEKLKQIGFKTFSTFEAMGPIQNDL